jgi:hypothetical protein
MRKYIQEVFEGILKDEKNLWSSKRFVGVIGAFSLIVFMYIYPSEYSNSSVLIMALGSLGVSGLESIFSKKK